MCVRRSYKDEVTYHKSSSLFYHNLTSDDDNFTVSAVTKYFLL